MVNEPCEIYILMRDDKPVVAHTTLQGAAMEQAGSDIDVQKKMYVTPVSLVDDHDS